MTDHATVQQYVVLPPRGLRNTAPTASNELTGFLTAMQPRARPEVAFELPGAPGDETYGWSALRASPG